MRFEFTDAHITDYHQLGFTIFRDLIPPALIRDLRREAEKGRAIAHERSGEQAQRLQPIGQFDLDHRPFLEFARLPTLTDAIRRLLGEGFFYGGGEDNSLRFTGILYEPVREPYCTMWHRDWRDNVRGLDLSVWQERYRDLRLFNQVNAALYEDTCTWVVPGSHLRRDTPGEVRRFPTRPVPGPELEGLGAEEREKACLDYCRSLPGALCAHLNAGDFMLYRNALWHLGNYVPYKKRATIHDGIFTAEFIAWFEKPPIRRNSDGTPADWENPNVDVEEFAQAQASHAGSREAEAVTR